MRRILAVLSLLTMALSWACVPAEPATPSCSKLATLNTLEGLQRPQIRTRVQRDVEEDEQMRGIAAGIAPLIYLSTDTTQARVGRRTDSIMKAMTFEYVAVVTTTKQLDPPAVTCQADLYLHGSLVTQPKRVTYTVRFTDDGQSYVQSVPIELTP